MATRRTGTQPVLIDKYNANRTYLCGNEFVGHLLNVSGRTLQRYRGKGMFGDMDANCTRYPYPLVCKVIKNRLSEISSGEDPNKELTRAKTVKVKVEIQERLKELIPLSFAGYISSDIVRKLYRTIKDVIISSDDLEEVQKQKLLATIELEAKGFQKDETELVNEIISKFGNAND